MPLGTDPGPFVAGDRYQYDHFSYCRHRRTVYEFVSSVRIPVRKLACVCGKIISLTNCVGNVSRLMNRNLFAVISSASSWNSHVHLSSESLTELTCKVVRHMKLFSAEGSLIVPVWKSAHFWPLLCSDGVHWSNFIDAWVILPNFPNLFIACKALNSIFGC